MNMACVPILTFYLFYLVESEKALSSNNANSNNQSISYRDAGVDIEAGDALVRHVEIVRQRMADHLGLLVDFLRHEVAVIALVDQHGRSLGEAHGPLDPMAVMVVDLDGLPRQRGPVAVLEIGDAVGEGRERDGVGTEIHFAIAVSDGERRSLARSDQKVVLAREQEG